mmetsp:Transcript_19190/g.41559  ORF Transcript_19190/g.41559 Transcript_19190/m.41559 type:complete len:208 (-) Transcript_19190:1177-1800(-)
MQFMQQLIDPGIHNRLSHKTQRTMPNNMCRLPSIHLNPRNTLRFLNQINMSIHCHFHNKLGIVRLPSPLSPHGILVMTPAKDTLVGTCQGGGGFHALVAGDSVMGMLVTSPPATELMLCPSTELDGGMRPDELVSLLLERLGLFGGDHLLWFLRFHGSGLLLHDIPHVFEVHDCIIPFAVVVIAIIFREGICHGIIILGLLLNGIFL